MKKLLVILLTMTALALQAQQPKQVYVTLDVSGSMSGNKYVLANYTTQMIVALCDEADDVHMILYGQEKELSRERNPLATIQKPINTLRFGHPTSSESQFDDIIGFNRVYRPSSSKQNWLFIVGDGYWSTYSTRFKHDISLFQDNVRSGTLNVCYLQTGENLNEHSDFTKFVEGLGVVDIRKSSLEAKTILAGCDHFAKKILGFSETSLKITTSGSNTIKVVAELPVKEFLVVYQDEVLPSQLPSIAKATCNGHQLDVRHKGTPTTQDVKSNAREKNLSGHVWRVKAQNGNIPANSPIEIEFDKAVNQKNISIYPIVDGIDFSTIGLAPYGGKLKQVDDKTFTICKDERTALVRVELNEVSKQNLPDTLLKKTRVTVKANSHDYPATYKDGGFECIIDLNNDETQYYAECDCPGYFSRVTPIMTIVKGECEPVEPPVVERPAVDFGTMSFSQLKNDKIRGVIQDAETLESLDPEMFDISVEIEDDFMYEQPTVSIDGNSILIEARPRGDWCECLFPTDLNIKVVSKPKAGAFSNTGKNYVQTETPVHLRIEKDRPWLSRCMWVIVLLVALLLMLVYLRMLMKKKRFKKNAMLTPKYYNYYGDLIDDQGGRKLRKEGFSPWVARWFLPMDERTTLLIDNPDVGSLTLIASESKDVVRILKSCCDWETMDIDGYDPETDVSKSKTVSLGDQGTIEVTKHNGQKDGILIFTSGSENDGAGYRMFLGLLMAASLVAIAALAWLMLRSF